MLEVYLNGEFVRQDDARVSGFDAAVQQGVGLFETMSGGVGPGGGAWVVQLDEHLARLAGSSRGLGLSDSLDEAELRRAVLETVERSGLERVRLRVTVTGGDLNLLMSSRGGAQERAAAAGSGGHRLTVMAAAQPATEYPEGMFERGVAVTIADTRANPLNPMEGHKTINYWWRLRELASAAGKGAAEALVLQVTNHLCGGCVSNVFVVKGGELWTPIARGEEAGAAGQGGGAGRTPERTGAASAGGAGQKGAFLPSPVLPGVVRGWVMGAARSRGMAVRARMLAIADLLDADEVFLTNSSWGVLPVVKAEREAIGDGVVGGITRSLIEGWRGLIEAAAGGV